MSGVYSTTSPQPTVWKRVSRAIPCSVCGKPDWCTYTGSSACCMRIESLRPLRNGGWLHAGGGDGGSLGPISTDRPPDLAPPKRRDRAYRTLVQEVGLQRRHQEHLREVRGFCDGIPEGFASAPPPQQSSRRELARRIIDRLGDDVLCGVPGFYIDRFGQWTSRASGTGFLIPVQDASSQILAFQIRLDQTKRGTPRYLWYSSRSLPGGTSPGTPVAVWPHTSVDASPVWVTEGSLKAAIASHHLSATVLGVPGVSNWRGVLEIVRTESPIIVAFDSDFVTNPSVARHLVEFMRTAFWKGHQVAQASWDPRFKGLDDALLAGAQITIATWPDASPLEPGAWLENQNKGPRP